VSKRLHIGIAVFLLVGGALLRLIGLENNPPGLWQDEASTGIDAFLLWTTGKDRAGVSFPIIARSFGDYPLALYRYLDAPIVGLFGLSIANERIVASITGAAMIATSALIVKRKLGVQTALCFMLIAALCPTWIHFSRYGSEAILMPATLVLGWLLIDVGADDPKKRWLIWLGALSLGASAYTYHAIKLFLPLWIAGFLVYQWPLVRRLWREERVHVIGPAAVFALSVLPSVVVAFSNEGLARPNTVVAWKHHSGAIDIARVMLNNYLSYFDPGMLFVRGGPAVAQSIPYLGIWNLIELPLIGVGLAAMMRSQERRFFGFILFWFLLGPVPGGITYETANIGRAIGWLPAPQIISAFGMMTLLVWSQGTSRELFRIGVPALLAAGWIATVIAVIDCAFFIYPDITQRDWQYDVTGAMKCAKQKRKDERLIVSPHFQMASVFATFHLNGLPYELAERKRVEPGELYLFPAGKGKPTKSKEICTIVIKASGKEVSYVYAHE